MTEQKRTWNFDVTRLSNRDLTAYLFFLEHERLPVGDEVSDEPEDLESYGTRSELDLIALAALDAQGVLSSPKDLRSGFSSFGSAGELPDTVDPDRCEGMQTHSAGGINLDVTYHGYRLAELAPILIKYRFYQ